MSRSASLLAFALAGLLLAAPADGVEFVRDEIRINMRAGPGLQFKILKLLTSGDSVTRLGAQDDWVQIRTSDGESGWVPEGYLAEEAPPSVALPSVQAKLSDAESRIEELGNKLAMQTAALAELSALRDENERLLDENMRYRYSSSWRWMATGAAILILGALIGLVMPRSNGARSRLKL